MGHGDELLLTGIARRMQQSDPRKVRVTYSGVPHWREVFDNNPRLARTKEAGDFQILEGRGRTNLRPYHSAKSNDRWTYNLDFRPDVGELYFTDEEKAYGEKYPGLILVEPNIKPGASPNKQWGWERWHRLVELMKADGITPVQMGGSGARLSGIKCISPPSFRMAAAVIANARAFVFPEGGLHHAAAACGIPGVVVFGGFTPVELTGYPMHRNLGVSLGDACGWRTPCGHCKTEMAKITPEIVLSKLLEIIRSADDCSAYE